MRGGFDVVVGHGFGEAGHANRVGFAWIGARADRLAILALTLYALLPVIRNTYTGIRGVDHAVVEAGRGMGLTGRQLLFQVELPLAVSVTHAAHMIPLDGELPSGELQYRNPYQASLDGNTVEMPVEQAAFSENNVRYQASLQFINNQIAELQLAIAGQ